MPKSSQTKIQAALLIAAASTTAVAAWSCRPVVTSPDIVVINNNQVGGPGATPGASPSPAPGTTCAAVAANRVGFFGIGCPSGVAPRNGQGVLPMGCIGFATSTPKDSQGRDVDAAVHGQNIAWLVTLGAERIRLVDVSEPFNKNVIPVNLGDVAITATVTPPGCGPIPGTLSFQVTAATASSGGPVASAVGVYLLYREPDGAYMGTWRRGDRQPNWR